MNTPSDEGYDQWIRQRAEQAIQEDRKEREKEMKEKRPEKPGTIIGAQEGYIGSVDS